MNYANLNDEEANHIKLFIKHFVVSNKQHRWKTIISMKPDKWVGASAYDCNQVETKEKYSDYSSLIEHLGITKYLSQEAYIFPIGCSAGEMPFKSSLKEEFVSNNPTVECVISIIPGKLAICFGHSGEFRLCKRI